VVTGSGRLVAVSGQVALDEHGALVGAGDPGAQALPGFENLRRCLPASSAVQVAALFRPELRLEVEALALVAESAGPARNAG
jgi:enamine deaminase RidA (YjgF/YER057c/UK114 family)